MLFPWATPQHERARRSRECRRRRFACRTRCRRVACTPTASEVCAPANGESHGSEGRGGVKVNGRRRLGCALFGTKTCLEGEDKDVFRFDFFLLHARGCQVDILAGGARTSQDVVILMNGNGNERGRVGVAARTRPGSRCRLRFR